MSCLRSALPLILLLVVTALLAACGNEAAPFAVNEQAQIACTAECADRGQCGELGDGRRAVLANEGAPAVTAQNRFFVNETPVTVLDIQPRELIAARDGVALIAEATSFPHMFYSVTDGTKTAWVSEWCLARP